MLVFVLEKVHAAILVFALSMMIVPAYIVTISTGGNTLRPEVTITTTATMNRTIVVTQPYLNPNTIILNVTNVLVPVNQTIPVNFRVLHNFTQYAMFYAVHDQRGTVLNLPLTWILMGGASGVIRSAGSVDMTPLIRGTGEYTVTFQNSIQQPIYVNVMIIGI